MEKISKDFSFDTERFLLGIKHFAKTTAIIRGLNHSIKTYDPETVSPFEADGLPLKFSDENGPVRATYNELYQWILKKGVEEIVFGLLISLVEAYKFVKKTALAADTYQNQYDEQELNERIEKIDEKAGKMHLPDLIDHIGNELNISLAYNQEIKSINKLRACLVHRNGIVEALDTNNQSKNALVISYNDLGCHVQIDGSIVPLTKELKRLNLRPAAMFLQADVKKELIVSIGEKIELNAEILSAIVYSSVNFIHELIHQMPIPEEIKARIIQPYELI